MLIKRTYDLSRRAEVAVKLIYNILTQHIVFTLMFVFFINVFLYVIYV